MIADLPVALREIGQRDFGFAGFPLFFFQYLKQLLKLVPLLSVGMLKLILIHAAPLPFRNQLP
jgi:hypothetical protein